MTQKSNWEKLHNRDLDWSVFRIRSQILQGIREFFNKKNFLEIEAPTLTPYPTLDNNIDSIKCEIDTPDNQTKTLYLHTSPEHAMKKLLAAGSDNIYYLGKVFRNNELTRLHNPEYTMVEWYRLEADYHDIMKDTQDLISTIVDKLFGSFTFKYQNRVVDLIPPWPIISISELFKNTFELSSSELLSEESLQLAAERYSIHYSKKDDWETLFHRLFMDKIEPNLGIPQPVFIIDYPQKIGLMARSKSEDSRFVERVELYIAGLELANGYSELTDPNEQLQRFSKQQKIKKDYNSKNYPIDHELIDAMKLGLPNCAGIALGIDRLLMFLLNKTEIQDVILFPF
ncbi:EF-P lysine aminoacylase EpmA [bacterium]